MIFIALIIWLSSGVLHVDKVAHKSIDECLSQAQPKLEQILKDPKTDDVLFAACVPSEGLEVSAAPRSGPLAQRLG